MTTLRAHEPNQTTHLSTNLHITVRHTRKTRQAGVVRGPDQAVHSYLLHLWCLISQLFNILSLEGSWSFILFEHGLEFTVVTCRDLGPFIHLFRVSWVQHSVLTSIGILHEPILSKSVHSSTGPAPSYSRLAIDRMLPCCCASCMKRDCCKSYNLLLYVRVWSSLWGHLFNIAVSLDTSGDSGDLLRITWLPTNIAIETVGPCLSCLSKSLVKSYYDYNHGFPIIMCRKRLFGHYCLACTIESQVGEIHLT